MIDGLPARLADLAALGQTTTYGALARDLGLTGPASIVRLATALESLMEEDAAKGDPLRAALLSARGSTLPAQGFFAKAATLGIHIVDPAAFVSDQRLALHIDTISLRDGEVK